MIKKFLINIVFLLSATIATAQQTDTLLVKLGKTANDTNRINIQLKLADYYIKKLDLLKTGTDSSLYYIKSAEDLSVALKAVDHRYRVMVAKAEFSIVKKNLDEGGKLFNEVIDHYHKTGDKSMEASVWQRWADITQFDDLPHIYIRRNAFNRAYTLYKSIHNELKAANALGGLADVDLNQGLFDQAENKLLEVLAQYKALKYPKIYYAYYLLADIYARKNEIENTLRARMDCVNSYENDPHHSAYDGMYYYYALANAYLHHKNYQKSLPYFQKAKDIAIKLEAKNFYYYSLMGIMDDYSGLRKYRFALSELRKMSDKYRSKTPKEESIVLYSQMKLYNLLHDVVNGEKLVPTYKKVIAELLHGLENDPYYYALNDLVKNSNPLFQHYVLSKQWTELSEELPKLEALPTKKLLADYKLLLYNYRFKLDSANGKTLSALKKFQEIKTFEDSITKVMNTKQIDELEASYESVKKDKTIQGLNNQSAIQKSNLEKSNLQRNITFVGILVVIFILGLLLFAYHAKQRSNLELQAKQDQINRQNDELSAMVKEEEKLLEDKDALLKRQEGLLTEKEWLLKEVHHRVKNNLQIVMSLLYTQSSYLQNTDAIEAIRDSQNRVQAISIIHQKLYSKSNVATVLMPDYVNELVRHLSSVFDCKRRKINIKQALQPINLDSAQAVPIGLILNEAITNSIKYAFGPDGGNIIIEGNLIDPEHIFLRVSDDGRGLPENFNLGESSSLGMEMMKALSRQLGSSFDIGSGRGVVITMKFKIEHLLETVSPKTPTKEKLTMI